MAWTSDRTGASIDEQLDKVDQRQPIGAETVAAAATTDIGAVDAAGITITGDETITSLGNAKPGTAKTLYFTGSATVEHNASIALPDAVDFVARDGDVLQLLAYGSEAETVWRAVVSPGSVRVEPGQPTLTVDADIEDGSTFIKSGNNLVQGPSAALIESIPGLAAATEAWRDEAEDFAEQTAADVLVTNANVVQTGLDRVTTEAYKNIAQAAALLAGIDFVDALPSPTPPNGTQVAIVEQGGVRLYTVVGGSWDGGVLVLSFPIEYNIVNYGANPALPDNTTQINAALDAAGDHNEVIFPWGDYIVDAVGRDKVSMIGRAKLIAKAGAANVVLLGRETSTFWYRKVEGLAVNGGGFANGFSFRDIASTQEVSAGRWLLDNVRIEDCVRGIEKLYGNISNSFRGMSVTRCDYGYWAQGWPSPVMHSGCDTFDQGHWHGCAKAAFYVNDQEGNGGMHVWNEPIIESNYGFGIFVKRARDMNMPITLNNVWFEANGSSGSVTIDGVNYTPRDMYFEGCSAVEINGIKWQSMQLVNSSVVMDLSFFNINTDINIDAASSLRITNAILDAYVGIPGVVIESVCNTNRPSGGTASVFETLPRMKVGASTISANVLFSDPGDASVNFSGTSVVPTTVEADGISYDTCQQLVQPASHTALHPTSFALTAGKYYVTLVEMRRGVNSELQKISFQGATTLCNDLEKPARIDGWVTVGSISKSEASANVQLRIRNDGASPTTLRLGAVQVLEFNSYGNAVSFFNARLLVAG